MKKFLIVITSLLIISYLVFSAFYFQDSARNRVCENFEVIVKDSTEIKFVQPSDIISVVKSKDLNPTGKMVKDINTLDIREAILINKLVKTAEVYAAQDGSIVAIITQRSPMLRVISDTEGSFYIDKDRERMPTSIRFSVYVPVATGAISEDFARNQLYDFAEFLQSNPEWDAWIDQIAVKKNEQIELIPRAGDFRIILGSLDDYEKKLDKFTLFVGKGLNIVGWNRYSEINLAYDNQVVCTRK